MDWLKESVSLITLAASIPLGILAWLYQKAWERQTERATYYKKLLDCIPGFTVASGTHQVIAAATEQKNFFIGQVRHLWIVAPTPVVIAANNFLDAAQGAGGDPALRELVLAMRNDTSVLTVMFPFLSAARRKTLTSADIKLYKSS